MLKLIIRQANWGILGSVFAFTIGFFIKTYVIREVGLSNWGMYATAHTFSILCSTILSFGISFVILKFFPDFLANQNERAFQLIRKILVYTIIITVSFLLFMMFTVDIFDQYMYPNINDFSYLLLLVSIHVPISIFMGIITSLYRSVLKIKEIVVYGTFVLVSVRAILTLIVFYFNTSIESFVLVELSTQVFVLCILFFLFNRNESPIFSVKKNKNYQLSNSVKSYGKNMYVNSLVSLVSTQSLSFLLGIMLPPVQMGVYSVLLTISGLTLFLNNNIRHVFAPAISKLFADKKLIELGSLYKKITFISNFFTIPFGLLICLFSDEIFLLFSSSSSSDFSLSDYKVYLFILVVGQLVMALSGHSKMIMIMTSLEKKEMYIQSIKGVLILILLFLFIEEYKLLAVVVLYTVSIFYVGVAQLISIKSEINVTPFSKELFYLVLFSFPLIWYAIIQNHVFSFIHFMIIPFFVFLFYFVVFYKSIIHIYKEVK